MKKEDLYKVGFIMKTHGLKGGVTVSLDPDSPADWSILQSVFIDMKGQFVPYFIEAISLKNDKAFMKFEDVTSIDEAKKLQKLSVYAPKKDRPRLKQNDFYNDEIVGFTVTDKDRGKLGEIKEVQEIGPNRFLVFHFENKEHLLPVNAPFIQQISKSTRSISVVLPEGFLEI